MAKRRQKTKRSKNAGPAERADPLSAIARSQTIAAGWRLVAGGDISYIDWETGNVKYYAKRSEWDNPRGGSSEAWEDVKPAVSKSFEDLLDVTNDSNGCYLYVYYFQTNGVRCYNPDTKEEVRIPKSRKQEEVA